LTSAEAIAMLAMAKRFIGHSPAQRPLPAQSESLIEPQPPPSKAAKATSTRDNQLESSIATILNELQVAQKSLA
jgi:hypothetical protein